MYNVLKQFYTVLTYYYLFCAHTTTETGKPSIVMQLSVVAIIYMVLTVVIIRRTVTSFSVPTRSLRFVTINHCFSLVVSLFCE